MIVFHSPMLGQAFGGENMAETEKPEGDRASGSSDEGKKDSSASAERFRLVGRPASDEFDEKQLGLHLQGFWKKHVEHQLQTFVLQFFKFFVTFVKEDQQFVLIMKNLAKLYSKNEWNGIIIVRGEGIEVAVYYEKLEFRISAEKFDMEIRLDQVEELAGAGFVPQVESLVKFLTEHVSTHSQAVEVFPDSADEIKSNICGFNPV